MNRTFLTSFIVLCLLSTAGLVGFQISVEASPELPVHNVDTGLDYATIQEAINANETLDGHTILVNAGTYYENMVVNKSVSLVGECKETTIIDGSGVGNVMEVTVSNVTIINFSIENSGVGWTNSGILLNHVKNCSISGNKLANNNNGIRSYNSSYNTIFGNNMTNNNNIGIAIWDFSRYNSISGNHVTSNSRGIWLFESSDNSVYENEITNNKYGIRVCYCAVNNKIYHNYFVDNIVQVYSWNSTNVWDDGYPSGGNYWSDYTGLDVLSGVYQNKTGSDGIGDTPYVIDENHQDNYPLMTPVSYYYSALLENYNELLDNYKVLLNDYSELQSNYDSLNLTNYVLIQNHTELQGNYSSLLSDYNNLSASFNILRSELEATISELDNFRNLMYIFTAATIILIATTVYLAIRKLKIKL